MAFLDEAGLEYFYKKLIDKIFPVGSVYMSADANFDPSKSWGGTWEKIENRFLLGSGTRGVGATGGEENVTLTTSQIPSHTHSRGGMGMYGEFTIRASNTNPSGVFYWNSDPGHMSNQGKAWDSRVVSFNAANNWWGESGSKGGGASHNNMPPFEVVNVWKRTA